MPPSLPIPLLLRRLAQQVLFAVLFGLRAVLVATMWLAVLPWLTLMAWRMYFSMGEATAWWISNRPRSESEEPASFYYFVPVDNSGPPPTSFLRWVVSHPLWLDLPADIFTGQIIASLIVLTFVAVFLLREWISQNARPGIFEDDEFPGEDQAAAPRAGAAPQPQQQQAQVQPPQRQNAPQDQNGIRQQDGLRPPRDLRLHRQDGGHRVGEIRRPRSPMEPRRREKGKGRQLKGIDESDLRLKKRHSLRAGKSPEEAQAFSRRVHNARIARRHPPRSASAPSANTHDDGPQESMLASSDFKFNFRPIQPLEGHSSSPASPSEPTDLTGVNGHPETNIGLEGTDLYVPTRDVDEAVASTSSASEVSETEASGSSSTPIVSATLGSLYESKPSPPPMNISPNSSPDLSLSRVHQLEVDETEAEAGPSGLAYHNGYEGNDDNGVEEDTSEEARGNLEAFYDGMSDTQSESDLRETHDQYFADMEESNVHTEHQDGRQEEEEVNGFVRVEVPEPERDDDDEEDEEDGPLDEEEEEDDEPDAEVAEPDDNRGVAPGEDAAAADVALNQNGAAVNIEQGAAEVVGGGGDGNDELDGNVEDDMEGAMEAIGMRGPIYGVFQNAALMIFILDTAIGIGIWIPFTVGKSAALLSLDPHRTLQLLHLPIRAIRIITDPIVDLVVLLLAEFLLPPIYRTMSNVVILVWFSGALFAGLLWGKDTQERVIDVGFETYNRTQGFFSDSWERVTIFTSWATTEPATQPEAVTAAPSFITTYLSDAALKAEPYFAIFGREVRLAAERFKDTWMRLALGHGPVERLFAVSLGYIISGVIIALYLNLLTVGTARSAGRAVRSAVRQQLLVIKVAAFIFIELVTFPFGCGLVLDLCTIWLFPEANLQSRSAFFVQAPLTAIFYHWVAGTLFMYAFAVLLSGCRSVMRPGAMWFIKDPQDQNSHPIRDILDRPALTQLRKIGISGIMYSGMVVCVVGSVAGLLILGDKSIMPFRWKNREPLSHVPVDLLFLHLVLPYTMRYFRPKKVVKKFATAIWKYLATKLRLTSYFFGGRHHSEEYTPTTWRDVFMQSHDDLDDAEHVFDGSFRRVPATDQLALPRDMRATAPVTEHGEPVDAEAQNLMRMQDAEAEKAQRDVKKDYMVVYLPPHFRYRIFCFIGLMWCICAMLLGLSVALPIQLGRSFFKVFTSREVHDGYSLIVGFYLLWLCYIIGKAVDRLDKRRQRRGLEGPRADLRIFVVKRGLLWFAKFVYMALFLGIVVPTLMALVVDLYIVLPLRLTLKPDMTPRIRIVDAWALGLLYAKIVFHVHRIHPANQITRGLQRIMDNGWTHPDPATATKEVIAPLTAGLLGMIVLPGALFKLTQFLLPSVDFGGKFIFMHVYPGIFVVAGLMRSAMVLHDLFSTWSQTVRDKEFLVEMRLLNHDSEKADDKKDSRTPETRGVAADEAR
ncbi:hypothetical protein AX17_006950 [Amanita inopinata Kibby_2008]|nr:hypothetical protein AX17_006950 [Amanita inopinata Kibby_2008]